MTRWLVLLAAILAGCAASPAASPSLVVSTPIELAASDAHAPGSASPVSDRSPLDAMLPVELGGVELHTFAVGEDTLARLADHLAIGPEQLEARFASDHGARFLQMYALRAPGLGGPRLVEAWAAIAYPPDVTDATVTEQSVAGRPVTVVNAPSAQARLGTYYLYASDETLLVVQAFDPEVAAEALAVLP